MTRARQLIESFDPDSPESFDIKAHAVSPVARLAATNGFKRDDRRPHEERWVKKLSNGNEAWLISDIDQGVFNELDWRNPKTSGGRSWHLMLVKKTNKCSVCQGTGKQAGGPCQPCNSTGKQKTPYFEHERLIHGNELTMNAVLGAFLQRLATWPAHLPKPGEPGAEKLFQ